MFDDQGREVPDTTPVPHRSQITRSANLMAQLQGFIQAELARQAQAGNELETEEEANDFDLDDDEQWTHYEEEDYQASFPAEPTEPAEGTAPSGDTPSPASATSDGSAEASKP